MVEIKHIRNWNNRVNYEEALKLAEEAGGRLATNKEVDEYLQAGKDIDYDNFPCWTGTEIEYDGEDCIIKELGKTRKIKLPLKNGWYVQDKFGIPSGEHFESKNKDARYLWRIKRNKCPVARVWGGLRGRGVGLDGRPSDGLGVAIVIENKANTKSVPELLKEAEQELKDGIKEAKACKKCKCKKHLGKNPPENNANAGQTATKLIPIVSMELAEHFRQSLLEAAEKLEPHGLGGMSQEDAKKLIRKLRISAGETL